MPPNPVKEMIGAPPTVPLSPQSSWRGASLTLKDRQMVFKFPSQPQSDTPKI